MKRLFSVMNNTLWILLVVSGSYLIFAYIKKSGGDEVMTSNGLSYFFEIISAYFPSCLCAYLGNRYFKVLKGVPVKSFLDKLRLAIYTLCCFFIGIIFYFISNAILQFCFFPLMNYFLGFTTWVGTDLSSPVFSFHTCILSVVIIMVVYQTMVDKYVNSKKGQSGDGQSGDGSMINK